MDKKSELFGDMIETWKRRKEAKQKEYEKEYFVRQTDISIESACEFFKTGLEMPERYYEMKKLRETLHRRMNGMAVVEQVPQWVDDDYKLVAPEESEWDVYHFLWEGKPRGKDWDLVCTGEVILFYQERLSFKQTSRQQRRMVNISKKGMK